MFPALFTTAKWGRQPKLPSVEEQINEMWYVHPMEYYAAVKRKAIVPHAATWVNPEDGTLGEIDRSQKRQTLFDST